MMKKLYVLLFVLISSANQLWAQCTLTNATSCTCLAGGTNCDLLPDITVSRRPLTVLGSNGVIEYSQTGNGVENGRLRISVTTPNIGHGPMETRSSNKFVCGTDTFVGTAPTVCPDGSAPKIIINQRIYQKNGNVMTYYDRPAGTMTYHPTHGHQHVDNWGVYTLRSATADPNPLNWPIVGNGAKLAFCLLDIGACTSSGNNGLCIADNGDTLNLSNEFYGNYQLGGGSYGCSATLQGISVGYLDTYVQSLDGMYINIPPGTCNGNYYIVCQQDPDNYFLEENDNNNVIAVPFTLTKQGGTVPVVTAGGATSFCAGGSVTLTCSGATSYLWSNGATTQSITVSQGGSYTCTVNGASSCSTTSAPVTVTVTPFPVTASASSTSVCSGTAVQLNATSTGGGTTTQVQSFTNSTVYNIPDNNTTGVTSTIAVSGITPATLSSGMVVSASVNITHTYDGDLDLQLISPSAQTILLSNRRGGSGDNFNNTTFSMSGSTAIASGSAPFTGTYIPDGSLNTFTGNANGNWQLKVIDRAGQDVGTINSWTLRINNQVTSTVSYAWTSNPGNFNSTVQNPTVTPTQNTTYTVVATQSGTGCTGTNSVAVNIANPTVAVNGNGVICPGQSTTLTASGASTYSWSPAAGLSATAGGSVVANPSTTTTYTVTGTASNGCTDTETFTVTVTTTPTLTTSGNVTICQGQSTQLSVSGANSYVWSPAGGLSATTGSTVTASPASTTTYLISGTVNGCATNNAQITVTVNPVPVLSVSPDAAICNGSSITLNASGASSYVWSPSSGLSGTSGSAVSASPSATTTYNVAGTSNGCTSSQNIVITVNPLPVLTTSGDETVCQGQSALLIVGGADSYSWSPSAGLNSTTGNNILATPASTSTYTVVGTNLSGCSASSQLTVNVNQLPVVTTSGDVAICDGSSATLTASGADSYLWTPSNGLNATTGVSVVASPSGTSTYTVTGTTNGCSGSASITVIVNAIPTVTVSNSSSVCAGQSAVLNAGGADTYIWSPSSGLNIASGSSVIATPPSTTTYTVTGTSSNCSSTAQVTVTVNAAPVVNSSANTSICSSASATLSASGADSYSWSPSTGLNTATGNAVVASPAGTTTYTVTGTSNGCSSTAQVTVTVNATPTVSNSGSVAVCRGQFTTLTAGGANTYSWSPATGLNATTGSQVTANPSATTTYTITGTSNGCSSTSSITVTVNSIPNVGVSASTTSVCNGQTATLTATGASTYSWTPTSSLNSPTGASVIASPSVTTTYFVTGVSADGCSSSNSITINANTGGVAPAQPGAITGNRKPCPGINEVYSISAVPGAVSYTWTPPAGMVILSGQGTISVTTSVASSFVSGNMNVVANGSCGVSSVRSTGLAKNAPATPASLSGPLTGLCNASGVFNVAAVTGATAYTWSAPAGASVVSGQGTASPTINVSNTFTSGSVCVTADNTCTSSTPRCAVIKKVPAEVAVVNGPAVVCVNQQAVNYNVATVFGATNYVWTVPSGAVITSGQGTTSINVNFGNKTGNVAVTASNACGSGGTKTKAITYNCRLGDNTSSSGSVSVTPNPATDVTNVTIVSEKGGVALLTLSDVLGNTVMIRNVYMIPGNNSYTMDLGKYSKGVYMLNVKTSSEKQTLKIVLK